MVSKGITTSGIDLAGKRYNLKYDIDAMVEIEISAQALSMGAGRSDFFGLLDGGYNVRELVLMIQAGLNGAKRAVGDSDFMNTEEVRKLVQGHYDYVRNRVKGIPEWKKAQTLLMDQVSTAARLGAGLTIDKKEDEIPPETK